MGAASGVISMIALVWLLSIIIEVPAIGDTSGDRVGLAAHWLLLPALVLFAILVVVGNSRFLSEAIDPTLHKEDRAALIDGRVADNTLQQYVLFLIGTLALSVNLTAEQMRAIPAAAIVFVVARIAFWIGYRIHPLYRAFGMAATSYLCAGIIVFALWKLLAP